MKRRKKEGRGTKRRSSLDLGKSGMVGGRGHGCNGRLRHCDVKEGFAVWRIMRSEVCASLDSIFSPVLYSSFQHPRLHRPKLYGEYSIQSHISSRTLPRFPVETFCVIRPVAVLHYIRLNVPRGCIIYQSRLPRTAKGLIQCIPPPASVDKSDFALNGNGRRLLLRACI
jgi:hypothetical protein